MLLSIHLTSACQASGQRRSDPSIAEIPVSMLMLRFFCVYTAVAPESNFITTFDTRIEWLRGRNKKSE